MQTLSPDFREFLRLLNSCDVKYLVIGGYAVGFYGYPRTTGDLDIWIHTAEENIAGTIHALKEFGFGDSALTLDLFKTPGRIIRMGYPPVRIELLTAATGLEFETCYARRVTAQIDGLDIPFVSRDDLLLNKRATGRTKDIVDLEQLE